ncbi:helix-turn-helix domain-containing protein [Streptomyces sp. NPDC093595]|uniref:helix-turn-helix domain-containing protein n=1 Tax=Streptomyces sp. NPDC093595 TaxID=3366045 RepID=UPI0038269189
MGTGTEGFAGFLRELKERSGRSYGALAKQMHMSTSTLHRYCNGDAVPTGFAPVERFARLCGADREELVRLHRAWIVADEARRRGRTGGAAAPEEAATAPAAAGAPEEPSTRAGANARTEGSGPPEPSATAEPGSPTPESNPSAAEPGPSAVAWPPAPAGGAGPGAPVPDLAASAGAPAARGRGRLRTLAAVAAGVLLTASGVAFAVSGTSVVAWEDPARTVPDAPVPSGTGSAAASGAGGRAASSPPAARATPVTPPASAAPAPSGGARGTRATPAPSGNGAGAGAGNGSGNGTGQRQAAPAPLTADVRPYIWQDPCSQAYVVNRPPGAVPPPPSMQDARGWVTALGGVPASEMLIEVVLQGTGKETVVLKDLHVRTVGKAEPLPGNAYVMGVGCGGEMRPQSLDVDLDAARPRPVPVAGQQGDRILPATDFPYKVSADDPHVLKISAHTADRAVRWYLELEWSSGGRSGTLRLDDRGRPFTTSAAAKLPAYQHPLGASAWEPYRTGEG